MPLQKSVRVRRRRPEPKTTRRSTGWYRRLFAILLATSCLDAGAGQQEWVYHKNADGSRPNGVEQTVLWLMNRARANPGAEGRWLASLNEPNVRDAVSSREVNLTLLRSEFDGLLSRPPAAFDRRLFAAALAHSRFLRDNDAQTHDGQTQRVREAGFQYRRWGGSVFSYAENALHFHAALNIDWGLYPDGMQPGRPHRQLLMAVENLYTSLGIAMVEAAAGNSIGPLIMTANYASTFDGVHNDHFNRFIVGTVWQDDNGDGQYGPGEGLGTVRVSPDRGGYYAVTGASGGYAIPVTSTGRYTLRFSGGELSGTQQRSAAVLDGSVLLDLQQPVGDGGSEARIFANDFE